MGRLARKTVRLGLAASCIWWAFICGGCGEAERGGSHSRQVQAFGEGWIADGLLVGSRSGELYRFRLREGVFEVAAVEVRGSIAFSSGVRCDHGTVLAGLEANGQRVGDLYCWSEGGPAEPCGMGIGSSHIAGVDCEVIAISQGSIREVVVDAGGSLVLHQDIPLEEPKSVAVGRRILVSGDSIIASAAEGGFVEIDRHTGKIVAQVDGADSGMSLLYCDDSYIIQSAPEQIVIRNRINNIVERGVSVRGIPVGIIRATSSAGSGVRYFAVVRFDDVLDCDIVDLDTMEYIEVSGVSAINVIQ